MDQPQMKIFNIKPLITFLLIFFLLSSSQAEIETILETKEMNIIKNKANSLFKSGKLDEAIELFKKGLNIATNKKYNDSISLFSSAIFNMNYILHNNLDVIKYGEIFVENEEKKKNVDESVCISLNVITRAYISSNDLQKAFDTATKGYKYCSYGVHMSSFAGAITNHELLASIYIDLRDYERALTFLYEAKNRTYITKKAFQLNDNDNDYKKHRGLIFFLLGKTYSLMGDKKSAISNFKFALEFADDPIFIKDIKSNIKENE